jgi:anthranilate synthase/aminodeoxychorismate synthase-like glutamine amidotransferase
MLLVIDNYDSFTYNLVQYLGELGERIEVRRNDEVNVEQIEAMKPDRILISPGPGTPNDAGIAMTVIEKFAGRLPILGVCLGHQAIGQVWTSGACFTTIPRKIVTVAARRQNDLRRFGKPFPGGPISLADRRA